MTIIEGPLRRGNPMEMAKIGKVEKDNDFTDSFDEIPVGPDVCGLQDLNGLNDLHFMQMHDFSNININQLLPKTEPQELIQPPSLYCRRDTLELPLDQAYSDQAELSGHSCFQPVSPASTCASNSSTGFARDSHCAMPSVVKVLNETNKILDTGANSGYWSDSPHYHHHQQHHQQQASSYPGGLGRSTGYAAGFPSSGYEPEPPPMTPATGAVWSSPSRASPESLVPAFSSFTCGGAASASAGPAGPHFAKAEAVSELYTFAPAPSAVHHHHHHHHHHTQQPPPQQPQAVPEPPAYSYQSLSSASSHGRLAGFGYSQGGSAFSSPAGSLSELRTAGCSPPRPIAAGPTSGPPSHAYGLSQSFPGAVPGAASSRSSSASSGNNVASVFPFAASAQPASCRSSPLSQHGASPPGGYHSGFHGAYTANGEAGEPDDALYMADEQQVSPLGAGDSLPGDLSPLDEAMGLARRDLTGQVPSVAESASRLSGRRTRSRSSSHTPKSMELWQFLWVLLSEQNGGGAVAWLDRSSGMFKVINQNKLCELWSEAKRRNRERPKVTRYSNLTRTLRYYYQRNLMKKGERDHVYQFIFDKVVDGWIQARARSATH